jgi:hypothetical protein
MHEVYKRMASAKALLVANDPIAMGRSAAEMKTLVEQFDKRWNLMHNGTSPGNLMAVERAE